MFDVFPAPKNSGFYYKSESELRGRWLVYLLTFKLIGAKSESAETVRIRGKLDTGVPGIWGDDEALP